MNPSFRSQEKAEHRRGLTRMRKRKQEEWDVTKAKRRVFSKGSTGPWRTPVMSSNTGRALRGLRKRRKYAVESEKLR